MEIFGKKPIKVGVFQHPAHFGPFYKAPAEKPMPHNQISWLNNLDLKLYIFL